MKEIQRWMYEYCQRDETVIWYEQHDGFYCHTDDVEELEKSHAKLLEALELALASWSWNMSEMDILKQTPYSKMQWVAIAKEAIACAKEKRWS